MEVIMDIKSLTSLTHPLIKHLVHLRQNHDYRLSHGTVVISGMKEVKELPLQYPIKTLLVCDENEIPKGIKAEIIYIVPENVMQKASGLVSKEGILAEVTMPPMSDLKGLKRIVVLDKIADPGNLGTILRTALALQWDGVFILEDSCDPFNDKALRAAKGAAFRLPIGRGSWNELDALIERAGLYPLAADLKGTPLNKITPKNKIALVLSNEAKGLSKEAAKRCDKVSIPISSEMESLNVAIAAGILMYVLMSNHG